MFTKENSEKKYNDNIFFSQIAKENTELVLSSVKFVDGTKKEVLVNKTSSTILIRKSYNTRANGSCDDLVLEPNEAIMQTGDGDGYDFAVYRIFNKNLFKATRNI